MKQIMLIGLLLFTYTSYAADTTVVVYTTAENTKLRITQTGTLHLPSRFFSMVRSTIEKIPYDYYIVLLNCKFYEKGAGIRTDGSCMASFGSTKEKDVW